MTAYAIRQKTKPGKPPKKVTKTAKAKPPVNPQRRHNSRNIPPFGRPAR